MSEKMAFSGKPFAVALVAEVVENRGKKLLVRTLRYLGQLGVLQHDAVRRGLWLFSFRHGNSEEVGKVL